MRVPLAPARRWEPGGAVAPNAPASLAAPACSAWLGTDGAGLPSEGAGVAGRYCPHTTARSLNGALQHGVHACLGACMHASCTWGPAWPCVRVAQTGDCQRSCQPPQQVTKLVTPEEKQTSLFKLVSLVGAGARGAGRGLPRPPAVPAALRCAAVLRQQKQEVPWRRCHCELPMPHPVPTASRIPAASAPPDHRVEEQPQGCRLLPRRCHCGSQVTPRPSLA